VAIEINLSTNDYKRKLCEQAGQHGSDPKVGLFFMHEPKS
jgi:hypothetical protein